MIGKSQLEKQEPADAINTLKKAIDAMSIYKKENDPMFKQLLSQEKDIRRIYVESIQQIKENRRIEKERAKAMFGGGSDDKKDTGNRTSSEGRSSTPENTPATPDAESRSSPRSVTNIDSEDAASTTDLSKSGSGHFPKKRVSFADGTSPGDDVDDAEPSFFEEHMEALLLLAGFGVGCWLVSMAWKRR